MIKKAFILILSAFLCHCSLFLSKREFPQVKGEQLAEQITTDIISDLSNRFSDIKNYRSLARVTLSSSGEAHRLRYVFVMDPKDDRMRIEVLAPSSALTLQLLLVEGSEATLLLLQDKVAYQGDFTPDEMEQFIGIRADMLDLLSYLTASLPTTPQRSFSGFVSPAKDGLVHLYSSDETMYLVIDESTHKPIRMMIKDEEEGSVVLDASYSTKSIRANNVDFPASLQLFLPEEDVKASVLFQMIKVNESLREELFNVRIPSDYTVRDIS